MNETASTRLKRLRMRSWRRGTKEMDLILGPFADALLAEMDPEELDLYESLLEENDQDLYLWVCGKRAGPAHLEMILGRVRSHHKIEISRNITGQI